jgi:hypothetical protein
MSTVFVSGLVLVRTRDTCTEVKAGLAYIARLFQHKTTQKTRNKLRNKVFLVTKFVII